ncbi:hypothetical protein VRK_39240 [Vibrio sp. MEBiC08052]|nr:hypothetical protein VRK_39240 [Vibrio sp. MEBiC08052]
MIEIINLYKLSVDKMLVFMGEMVFCVAGLLIKPVFQLALKYERIA